MPNHELITQYKYEICEKLNKAGFKCYGEDDFIPADFPKMKDLFQHHLIHDPNIYNFAVNTGLIHRDFCPLCGDNLSSNHGTYSFFGRSYFMCNSCLIENKPIKKNSEGCFIATACYGDYDHEKVLILRSFRDKVLIKYSLGQKLVKIYYVHSPVLAEKLGHRKKIIWLLKSFFLDPIVTILKLITHV